MGYWYNHYWQINNIVVERYDSGLKPGIPNDINKKDTGNEHETQADNIAERVANY